MKTFVLLAFSSSLVYGAVNGDSLQLQPGPQPDMWMELGNDNFISDQPDDNLTAEWAGGINTKYFSIGFDYSMLTEKNFPGMREEHGYSTTTTTTTTTTCWPTHPVHPTHPHNPHNGSTTTTTTTTTTTPTEIEVPTGEGIRDDEFTLVAGPHAFTSKIHKHNLSAQVLGGCIIDGNLDGQWAQSAFHRNTGNDPVYCQYDTHFQIKPVIMFDFRDDYQMTRTCYWETQYQIESTGSYTKWDASFFPYISYKQIMMFAGPTYERAVGELTETSYLVNEAYGGLGFTGGVCVSHRYYMTAYVNHNKIGNGILGVETNF